MYTLPNVEIISLLKVFLLALFNRLTFFFQTGGHRPGGPHPGGGLKSHLNLEAIQQLLDPLLEFK